MESTPPGFGLARLMDGTQRSAVHSREGLYPELKADRNFRELQRELTDTGRRDPQRAAVLQRK